MGNLGTHLVGNPLTATTTLPGHTRYVIVNIHGPFPRDQREKLDEWLAQLPDVGIFMGEFNSCVWGRPAQPTR